MLTPAVIRMMISVIIPYKFTTNYGMMEAHPGTISAFTIILSEELITGLPENLPNFASVK
jgi:hypothetical protein